ncbi:hypothetical protein JR316_0013049 [Psilocybe cubensis]|uniref:F-box domain-containing protein n=2 Tax=Psilocybe cubensis TaxID=181762 RepID=A0A8H7XTV2_PSICU|nr:hypothetical protein JR316_0013049 [Psilocybe cubensis]KAH9474587.1 hypothetical protein JR316_0013049 [Psilocybe cubensis]
METPQTPTSDFSSRRRLNQTLVVNEAVECENDITSLQNVLIDLKYKRMALNTKLNSVHDLMAELPLEVTTEIFQLVVDSQEESNLRSLPTQFLLGRVCKAWRDTVWKHPSLWKDIRIQIIAEKYPKQEELLGEWLNHSGTRPITVSIASKDRWQPPQSFATLLLGTSQRWTAFTCCSPLSSISEGLAADPPPSFPLLSSIKVFTNGLPQNESMKYNFNATPKLRNIFLSHPYLCLPASYALSFINSLQNIRKLVIWLTKGSANQIASQHTGLKILPSLNSLCLTGENTAASVILDRIITPALMDLRLWIYSTGSANLDHAWITSLNDLRERSAFSLSNLSFKGAGIGQEGILVDAVGSFPTLSSLHIEDLGKNGNFVLSDLTIG